MDRVANPLTAFNRAQVPPATPPAIDSHADAAEAASLPKLNGDSDFPGTHPAETPPGEDDRIEPTAPPEVEPLPDSTDQPDAPDEVTPDQPSVIPPPD